MAEIKALIKVADLKTNRLSEAKPKNARRSLFAFHYDERMDSAVIFLVEPTQPTIVYYLDGSVGFIYEEDSLEIVGLRIEDFEASFLPANQSVQQVWLSISYEAIKDFGELVLMLERTQPIVVKEVVRATRHILGEPGAQIEALVAA